MSNNIEFDGKCAFATRLGKDAPTTNLEYLWTKNGRTFSFLNPVAKFLFKLLPNSIEKADRKWNKSHT